jgi:hypothetical protein
MRGMLKLSTLSADAFAALGRQRFAYVKRTGAMGREVYAVHAADGSCLAQFADREVAHAALRQQDLEPLSIH